LYVGEVGGEELEAMVVEVPAGAVFVLGGAWVGVAGDDLGIVQRYAGVEGWLRAFGLLYRTRRP
jgi:hypothetical protein